MTDIEELRKAYHSSGVDIDYISNYMNRSRNRVILILSGADLTVSEMILLSGALSLTKEQMDKIFLSYKVN